MLGDDARLRQVVTNLVSNAITHTPAGTPVALTLQTGAASRTGRPRPGQGWVRVGVHDQGPGLSDEDRERVFERFYRADKSRTRAAGRQRARALHRGRTRRGARRPWSPSSRSTGGGARSWSTCRFHRSLPARSQVRSRPSRHDQRRSQRLSGQRGAPCSPPTLTRHPTQPLDDLWAPRPDATGPTDTVDSAAPGPPPDRRPPGPAGGGRRRGGARPGGGRRLRRAPCGRWRRRADGAHRHRQQHRRERHRRGRHRRRWGRDAAGPAEGSGPLRPRPGRARPGGRRASPAAVCTAPSSSRTLTAATRRCSPSRARRPLSPRRRSR